MDVVVEGQIKGFMYKLTPYLIWIPYSKIKITKQTGLPLVYIKKRVIKRNLQSLGISLAAAGPSVHQNLLYQNYFRQVRAARVLT